MDEELGKKIAQHLHELAAERQVNANSIALGAGLIYSTVFRAMDPDSGQIPKVQVIVAIAKFFGCSTDRIIFGKEAEHAGRVSKVERKNPDRQRSRGVGGSDRRQSGQNRRRGAEGRKHKAG